MAQRYDPAQLLDFLQALFEAEGLSAEVARVVARGFLDAELLGYPSHGLIRVPANLVWLRSGATRKEGMPRVLSDRAALASWDADRLPGYWIMHLATTHAIRQARNVGLFALTVRRAQHVACLAAALIPVLEADLVALMMVSSPGEAFVSPFGGSERLFSNNPVAFAAPAPGGPVLFDVSMAITAGGQVARAARLGLKLPEAALKSPTGALSADPSTLEKGGSVMPIGGVGHGHKGHALTILTEVLTQALPGYGRAADPQPGEQNSVYLQVMDPSAFTDRTRYDREMAQLVARIETSRADDPAHPVRVPGRRAWQKRMRDLREGLTLDADVITRLVPFADAIGMAVPDPRGD